MKTHKNLTLKSFDGSRLNNFTTMRIILAWSVLYGHGYAVQKTTGIHDPLNIVFQGSTWIGAVAVNGFFAISGFLVTASIIKRGVLDYSLSRILRIFPALIVCILISVFVIGPLFTELSFYEYLSQHKTYDYLKNATLIHKTQWYLPEVFSSNTSKAINGSLWTLPVEARCYLLLAVVSLFAIFKKKLISNLFIVALFIFSYFYFDMLPLISVNPKWARPAMFFLIGVFFYINRGKVPIDYRLAFVALVAIGFSFGKQWFIYVFPIFFVYLIFYLVYATKYLNTDKKIGDVSYGIYIYAWPVQQMVASLFPHFTPIRNTFVSTIIVFTLAYLSWHILEKPVLSLKKTLLRTN
jgi:peptidoglycan/LPS O-acetylase OafA/YrhL